MPLIQVTSGGQRSLLKKKLQVCESQQSCSFVGDQILIFHHNLQINSLKILQCDFLDFFSYFVSHSWGIPMMKITGLSHLFKWENLHNWWLTKYFFAPLYTVACESLGTPCRICENVNNFNKIRDIIQNACYFLEWNLLDRMKISKFVLFCWNIFFSCSTALYILKNMWCD